MEPSIKDAFGQRAIIISDLSTNNCQMSKSIVVFQILSECNTHNESMAFVPSKTTFSFKKLAKVIGNPSEPLILSIKIVS